MKKKLIIHVDKNHPILIEGLKKLGYKNDEHYTLSLKTTKPGSIKRFAA